MKRLRPSGYTQIIGDGRLTDYDFKSAGLESLEKNREADTYACGHCSLPVHVAPKANPSDEGGYCFSCQRFVCPHCKALGRCTPIEERIEAGLRKQALRGL